MGVLPLDKCTALHCKKTGKSELKMKTGIEGENFEVKEYGLLNAIRFRTTTYALCGSNECASPDFDDAVLHQAFDVIV